MSEWIEVGSPAPQFSLPDQDSVEHELSKLVGQTIVLYFYPRDDTPGCTKQACGFRDQYREFEDASVLLFGVSGDSQLSHQQFREKYSLPFPLLIDSDNAVAKAFGAYREKNLYGKKSMGIQRSTFVIDPDGQVAKVWKRVKVDGHSEQVLNFVQGIK